MDRRWVEVFSSFQQECIPHNNLKLLIEGALSSPSTNAAVERVFSLSKAGFSYRQVFWAAGTELVQKMSAGARNILRCVKVFS